MLFVALAAAVVVWFFATFRWALLRARPPVAATAIVIILGAASIVADVREMGEWHAAARSKLAIRAIDRGSWWELRYDDGSTRFNTANELHVPSGAIVRFNGRELLARETTLRFISLGPPRGRTLHVIADPQFARWFRREASPARAATPLFASAGCAYCHVIRGVAEHPWNVAPDLTHVASRATIAGTGIPMRRADLAGWIVDSRGLKKSSAMPVNRLDPKDLLAMTDYLESLR